MIGRRGVLLVFLVLVLALIEWRWRTRYTARGYDWRASLASLGIAAGHIAIRPIAAIVIATVYTRTHQAALLPMRVDDWRVWTAGFFAVEFSYYWFHRWNHLVNWLWATHAVHHSASEMTLPAAVRLGWTSIISGGWMMFVPLVLLGFPALVVTALLAGNLLYQYGLHTEAVGKLGWLENVLNTPSHHRAHHASDAAYIDCNFGGVLIVFDRLFGTYRIEPDAGGLTYGLVKPVPGYNPIRIAFAQWRVMGVGLAAAQTWRERATALFGRPEALDRLVARTPPPQGFAPAPSQA